MNRRQFVFTLSGTMALLAAAMAGHAECGGPGHGEFVDMTYQKQARLLAEKTAPNDEEFNSLFSPGMRRLMKAPRRNTKNPTIGPTLNVFFGWGVLPGADITVGRVAMVSGDELGPATFGVEIEHRGERHKILVHVIMEKDEWRIANIIYDSGKSLLDHYRSITGS
jgi:hypothetical protein